jgi:hypothetical protein
MATETKQQLKMDSNASTPATQRREHTLLQNLGGHHHHHEYAGLKNWIEK